MKRENFFIKFAGENEPIVIEILADIGEDLFSELFGDGSKSITVQSISEQLKEKQFSEIHLRIASYGGDFDQAQAIRAAIINQNKPVKIKYLGFAASAATHFSDLGESEISDTGRFLIHKASVRIEGNANEMKTAIEQLELADDIQARIYQRATSLNGKAKKLSQIHSLMEEEKWITAQEAVEFGLVTKINKGIKITARAEIIEAINKSNLPKINTEIEMEKSFFEKLSTSLNEIKSLITGKQEGQQSHVDVEAINARITDVENSLATAKTENETLTAEITALKAEKETAVSNEAKVKADLEKVQASFSAFAQKNAHTVKFEAENIIIDPVQNSGASELSAYAKNIKDRAANK